MFDSSKLDAYLTGLCQARDLPGVSAAIMGPDGLEYAFNYGFRDGAFTRPVDNDTLFGVASMSKSMTALCACILACEGRLDLNAPVSDFFPEFELAGQPREAATVRTLAMHTAGIPPMEPLEWSIAMNSEGRSESDWLREMKRTAPNKMETIDQIIAYIAHCGYNTLGAPGEVMSYSNEGYAILSYIVDQAAGVPLEQFMQARIFDPLGMTRTILDNGVKAARALSGGNITSLFEVEDGRRTCDDCWSVLPPFRGCAMVKSTSRDMAAYYRMIANMGMHEGKQAIPAHAVDLLVGRYHPLSHLMTMCMGLNKREFSGHVVCEHAGGLHGVSSKGALLLGEGYGFAVLCNQGDEDMDALLYGMLCAVMGLPLATNMDWFTPAGRDFSAPHMIRGRYIGHEGVPSILCIHCEEDGSHLRGTRDGEDLRLVYCGGARFLAVKPDAPGTVVCHLEFLIRAGRAWGVRVGTRVFERD